MRASASLSTIVAIAILVSNSSGQDFKPQKHVSWAPFPGLTVADLKKSQVAIRPAFGFLARLNDEMLSEKPDLKNSLALKSSAVNSVLAIPNAPKGSAQAITKDGMEKIAKRHSDILVSDIKGFGPDLPELKRASIEANRRRNLLTLRSNLRHLATAFEGDPAFALKKHPEEK